MIKDIKDQLERITSVMPQPSLKSRLSGAFFMNWEIRLAPHGAAPHTTFMMMMMMKKMACRHIPTMTKSRHGGEMSVMIKVGMCQCQNPTIHDKVQLGPVGSSKLFNMPPELRHSISAQLGPSDRTQ